MIRWNVYVVAFLLLGGLICPFLTQATHVHNFEMFYRWKPYQASDSTYEFTLILYRDCNSSGLPPLYQIKAESQSTARSQSFGVNQLPLTGIGVPPLQPLNMFNCLDNFNQLCIEERVHRGNWTSPERADDWIFSFEICCRTQPFNPQNIGSNYIHIESGLNNLDFPDSISRNTSPLWHNRRPNHIGHLNDTIVNFYLNITEEGRNHTLNGSTIEYDGDSVSYKFYNPQGQYGMALPFINGYSLLDPIPTIGPPLTINPVTGISSFVPDTTSGFGIFIVGVEAEEWRNDTVSSSPLVVLPKRIGFNRREVVIWILDSTEYKRDSVHVSDITLDTINTDSTLEISFENSNTLWSKSLVRCSSLSADGSEFYIVDSSTYVAPNPATLKHIFPTKATWTCVSGNTENVILTLSEPLSCGDYYIFLKTGTDLDVLQSECGFWEPAGSNARIHTNRAANVDLGKDKVFCKNANYSITLNAGSSHTFYEWNTSDKTSNITVNYPDTFWVKATNEFDCHAFDTIIISEVPCTPNVAVRPSSSGKPVKNPKTYISEIDKPTISFYPNPTSDVVYIESTEITNPFKVEIFNTAGQRVNNFSASITSNGIMMNLENLEQGMYFVNISKEDQLILSEKLIVKRN